MTASALGWFEIGISPIEGRAAAPIPPPSYDRHVRRDGDDYATALAHLLPQGIAWPRQSNSTLMKTVNGLGQVYGYVDGRAADLLERETDASHTLEMLEDWERNWNLPDSCVGEMPTIEARRTQLLQRITMLGAQSRQFFIDVANWIDYAIQIEEFSPIMGGISRGGEYRWEAGAPEIRFYWITHVSGVPVFWMRGGVAEGGKDHHAEWTGNENLECLITRYMPAHTLVIFDYLEPDIFLTIPTNVYTTTPVGTIIGFASLTLGARGTPVWSLYGMGLFKIDEDGNILVASNLAAFGAGVYQIILSVSNVVPEVSMNSFPIEVKSG